MYTADRPRKLTRRDLLAGLGAAAALPVLSACAPTSREEELQAELAQAKAERDAAQAKLDQVGKIAQGQSSPQTAKDARSFPTNTPETPPTPATRFERNVRELNILWQKDLKRYGEMLYKTWPFPRLNSGLALILSQDAVFLTTSGETNKTKFSGFELATGKSLLPETLNFEGVPIGVWRDVVWIFPVFKPADNRTDNFLLGLSAKDGSERFKLPFVPPLADTPVAFGNKMFFIKYNDLSFSKHFIVEVDATNGKMQEKGVITTPQGYALRTQIVTEDYVIINYNSPSPSRNAEPDLRAISKITGGELTAPPRAFFLGGVKNNENSGELLLALLSRGSSTQELVSIAALVNSGSRLDSKWEIPLQSIRQTQREYPLGLDKDMILMGPLGGRIRAINPQTGVEFWKNDQNKFGTVLGLDNDRVYVSIEGEEGTKVAALNKKDGEKVLWEQLVWKRQTNKDGSYGISYSPFGAELAGNNLVLGREKRLVFLDRASGLPTRPDINIDFDPVNIYSTKRFLIAEGRDKVAVIG